MPLKGVKRAPAAADGGSSKRCKVVANAVKASTSLPETVLAMLGSVVQGTLGVPPGDRDAFQKAFVEMLGVALGGEETALKGNVAGADAGVADASAGVAESEAATKGLDDAIAAKADEIKAKEAKRKEDGTNVQATEADLKTAQKAQKGFEDEIGKVREQKDILDKLVGEDFTVLKDNPPTEKRAVNKHIGSITKTLTKYAPDEAMMIGIPSSLGKKPDERGAFDAMLIDHLSEILTGHLGRFAGRIATSEKEAAEVVAAVGAAKGALDAAKAQQSTSGEALKAAEDEEKVLQTELKEAQKKLKEMHRQAENAANGKGAADGALAGFEEVLATFALERDGPPPAPEEPAGAEAPVA